MIRYIEKHIITVNKYHLNYYYIWLFHNLRYLKADPIIDSSSSESTACLSFRNPASYLFDLPFFLSDYFL